MINNFSDFLKKRDFLLNQAEFWEKWEYGQSLGTPLPEIFLVPMFLTRFHDCFWGLFDHMHTKYQPATVVLDYSIAVLSPQ